MLDARRTVIVAGPGYWAQAERSLGLNLSPAPFPLIRAGRFDGRSWVIGYHPNYSRQRVGGCSRHVTQRHLAPLLREAGLPAIRFHDLRHTYATLQLAAGTNPKLVAEVLGHKDVGITLDRYSHSQPTMHREAAERLDAMLGRTSG